MTMDTRKLHIPATERSPEVTFDSDSHHLKISGESYPEDVVEFYEPLFDALSTYLERLGDGSCRVDLQLIYFNSGSAEILMSLLHKLDDAAKSGASVRIYWHFDEDDDRMQELGEELGAGVRHAEFSLESTCGEL